MFVLFEKLFRYRRAAAPSAALAGSTSPGSRHGLYSIVPPVWRVDGPQAVFRGLSGQAIGVVKNLDQALTLRDTLNLANGEHPSRRLLDAIYLEEATLESDPPARA